MWSKLEKRYFLLPSFQTLQTKSLEQHHLRSANLEEKISPWFYFYVQFLTLIHLNDCGLCCFCWCGWYDWMLLFDAVSVCFVFCSFRNKAWTKSQTQTRKKSWNLQRWCQQWAHHVIRVTFLFTFVLHWWQKWFFRVCFVQIVNGKKITESGMPIVQRRWTNMVTCKASNVWY